MLIIVRLKLNSDTLYPALYTEPVSFYPAEGVKHLQNTFTQANNE